MGNEVEELLATQIRLERERDQFQAMFEVTRTLAKPSELRELFVQVSTALRKFVRQDYAGLAIFEDHSNHLRLYAMDFPEGKGLIREDLVMPRAGSLCGAALNSGKPILMTSLLEDDMAFEVSRLLLAEGLKSACFIPLVTNRGPLGTLNLGCLRPDAFSADQVHVLTEIAPLLSAAVENSVSFQSRSRLKSGAEATPRLRKEPRPIIGAGQAINQLLRRIEMVAPTDAAVLLIGETGTGKELFARSIHDLSPRRGRNFVTVNCTAIPAGLLESELFGHERGAFTGAVSARFGRFELANGGTLFLDEVGDIPLELQPKLLRVLQENEFERLGSTRTVQIDVRIIAATHRNLQEMTSDGQFRSDLFYRLNVFRVHVPPLRDRLEDIETLVQHFMRKYSDRFGKRIDAVEPATLQSLRHWHWPGNVRELEHLVERAVILSPGHVLELPLSEFDPFTGEADGNRLRMAEGEMIRRVLQETHGIIGGSNGAAARLGLKRSTLQSKLKKLGL